MSHVYISVTAGATLRALFFIQPLCEHFIWFMGKQNNVWSEDPELHSQKVDVTERIVAFIIRLLLDNSQSSASSRADGKLETHSNKYV